VRRPLSLSVVAICLAACVDPLTTQATNTPEWDAKNIKGYADTIAGLPPEIAFAWGFVFEGDVAHWHECPAIDMCGHVERERRSRDVLGVEHVGQATIADAGAVEVVKLSLAPRPKYVVPITKLAR
jgi:hypothetical protein